MEQDLMIKSEPEWYTAAVMEGLREDDQEEESSQCLPVGCIKPEITEDNMLVKPPKRLMQWEPRCMEAAVVAVVEGGSTLRDACSRYGVPFETLRRRVNKMRPGCTARHQMGAPTVFTNEQERALSIRLQVLTRRGFPITRTDIRRSAYKYAELIGVPHRFDTEHKIAGYEWLHGFMSRNPSLVVNKPEMQHQPRADRLTREWLDKFYDVLESTVKEHNLKDRPEHIYNVGESRFLLTNEPENVVSNEGDYNSSKGDNVTIVSCCNAAGIYVPPVVIFKGLWHQRDITEGLPVGADVFVTSNGCMNEETLLLWLDHFARHKPSSGTVLLLLDGHNPHAKSLPVIEFCLQHNVVCVCLPRHTTRALHPMDKSFFKSLKTAYKQAAKRWCLDHPKQRIKKEHFGGVLAEAWNKAATVDNAVSGFGSLGIFPFDRRAIPDHGFSTTAVKSEVLPVPIMVRSCATEREDVKIEVPRGRLHEALTTLCEVAPSSTLEKAINISRNGGFPASITIEIKKKCNFCGQMSSVPTTSLKTSWIKCEVCKEWYHQYCVGGHGKAHLICGKCV